MTKGIDIIEQVSNVYSVLLGLISSSNTRCTDTSTALSIVDAQSISAIVDKSSLLNAVS